MASAYDGAFASPTRSVLSNHMCPGTLVFHLDGTGWCSQAGCEIRSTGDVQHGASAHVRVMACSLYFNSCPACADHL